MLVPARRKFSVAAPSSASRAPTASTATAIRMPAAGQGVGDTSSSATPARKPATW
jgi:hypothetical protein